MAELKYEVLPQLESELQQLTAESNTPAHGEHRVWVGETVGAEFSKVCGLVHFDVH